jgi:hypothetical protein
VRCIVATQLLVTLHLQLAQLARDIPAAQPKIQQCQELLDRTGRSPMPPGTAVRDVFA